MKRLITIAVLLLVLPACATSGGQSNGDSSLMGMNDEPARAIWENWTPTSAENIVPQSFVDETVAFDYWQIDDEDTIAEGWTGLSAVLDFVRREGMSDAQKNTATLLLQALDSRQAPEETMMDVTYVVSLDQEAQQTEGLVVRLYAPLTDKGVTPGAAIYLGREAGSGAGFDKAVMWAVPGFEEAEAFTVALDKTDAGWAAHKLDGAVYPTGAPSSGSLGGASELAQEIFATRFWDPLTRVGFVEAKPRAEAPGELPEGIDPALGLEVRERQIEEIYDDTVFPPRVEGLQMENDATF